MTEDHTKAPNALVLIAPGCPHCASVVTALSELVKGAEVGELEIVNVAARPERAAELGVRTAPWTQIGPFVFEGAHGVDELRTWAGRANDPEAMPAFLSQQLAAGRLAQVQQMVRRDPDLLERILGLVEDTEAPMQVRLGVGAVLEEAAERGELDALLERLGRLSRHEDHRVRSDACHYLGLSKNPAAAAYLRPRLDDEAEEVREIAAESLESLDGDDRD